VLMAAHLHLNHVQHSKQIFPLKQEYYLKDSYNKGKMRI
jgi:hypothetical protein